MRTTFLVVILLLAAGSALAERYLFADELGKTGQVPTVELSSDLLTDITAWASIEEVFSARKDLLQWSLDPKDRRTLLIKNKAGAKGETDLLLKVGGQRFKFRLLLGVKTQPLGYVLMERRQAPPVAATQNPAPPATAPAQPSATLEPAATRPVPQAEADVPGDGPIPAPVLPLEAASPGAEPPSPKTLYLGLSVGYPPLPVAGSFGIRNLLYGAFMGLDDFFLGFSLQLGGAWHPAGGGQLEGYLVKSLLPQAPVGPYLGLGGGVAFAGGVGTPFVGGLAGAEFSVTEALHPFAELTPRLAWLEGGRTDLIVGLRLGLKVYP